MSLDPVDRELVRVNINNAFKLLSDSRRWTKGTEARNYLGTSVSAKSKEACQWCASGAVAATEPDSGVAQKTLNVLDEAVKKNPNTHATSIVSENDGPRGYAGVVEAFASVKNSL